MTDRDPAFLWETEALRSAAHRIVEAEIDAAISPPAGGNWMTLREANRATGIPVETLRKWARRSTIPTYLTSSNSGTSIRMVDLDGVAERAEQLGRATAMPPEIKVADVAIEPAEPSSPSPPPPGTMIVPVDAWNKMLNQLGNLHEAGQQLAVAKERAAKAETEAKFLRERLAEIRQGEAPTPDPPPPPAAPIPAPEPASEPPTEKVWQFFVRSLRGRRSG